MEIILELKDPGIFSDKFLKQIVACGIIIIFLSGLYMSAFHQKSVYLETGYNETAYSKTLTVTKASVGVPDIRNIEPVGLSESGVYMPELSLNVKITKDIMPDITPDIKSVPVTDISENTKEIEEGYISEDVSEENEAMLLTVNVYGNGGTPAVAESSCTWETFSVEDIAEPYRAGKIFDGWYLDEECTKPVTEIERSGTTVSLYAGWREFPGFISNDAGNITGYTDPEMILVDGLLILPSYEACTGVEEYAFEGIEDNITELYIPANIRHIAPGAFDKMNQLLFIQVSPDNPEYYSDEGILYNKDGSVVAYPGGRE